VFLIVSSIILHFAGHKGPYCDLGAAQNSGKLVEEGFIDTHTGTSFDKEFAIWCLNIFVLSPKDSPELASDQTAVVGWQAFVDFAIGRLDETVRIDACVGCEVADEANVLTIGCLNWADATIVRLVYVAYFEACAFAGESTRAKC